MTDHDQQLIKNSLIAVEQLWEPLTRHVTADTQTLIGLPHPYIVPSTPAENGFSFRELYYFDSYWIVLGLLSVGRKQMAVNITDNLLGMVERFGLVPNANRFYMLSRSQQPYLALIIKVVYEQADLDQTWLARAYALCAAEYTKVWTADVHPHHRKVFAGLSRYYDINVLHAMAEAESGWDYTTRFDDRCLDFIPVDLNSLLYNYEINLSWMASQLGDGDSVDYWQERAQARGLSVIKYLWHIDDGWFYDFDFVNQSQGRVRSLAGLWPLFTGVASQEQAGSLHERLDWFETDFGLSATALDEAAPSQKQWANPNGWAPLQMAAYMGLKRYGFDASAERIAGKWLRLVAENYEKTCQFYEKYNVVRGDEQAKPGVYDSQAGFGWTNAAQAYFARELGVVAAQ